MGSRLIPWLIGVVVAGLLAGGCGGGDKYIIKGLDLPPGAVVKNTYDVDDAADLTLFGDEQVGKVIEAKMVHFDSSLDWYGVCGHINQCLEPQGYEDSWAEFGDPNSVEARVKERLASSVRVWTGPDGYHIVELVNYASFRSMSAGIVPTTLGDADFLLAVVHCNPAEGGGAGGGRHPGGGLGPGM